MEDLTVRYLITLPPHMRHIFRKLGIGSRVELARIVIEQSQPQAPGPHHQND
jgi:hypothetical protein